MPDALIGVAHDRRGFPRVDHPDPIVMKLGRNGTHDAILRRAVHQEQLPMRVRLIHDRVNGLLQEGSIGAVARNDNAEKPTRRKRLAALFVQKAGPGSMLRNPRCVSFIVRASIAHMVPRLKLAEMPETIVAGTKPVPHATFFIKRLQRKLPAADGKLDGVEHAIDGDPIGRDRAALVLEYVDDKAVRPRSGRRDKTQLGRHGAIAGPAHANTPDLAPVTP